MEKSLVLAEKGSPDDKDSEVELLTAGKHFRILATMNPGGDFGKKEVKLLPEVGWFSFLFQLTDIHKCSMLYYICIVVNNSVLDYKLIKMYV